MSTNVIEKSIKIFQDLEFRIDMYDPEIEKALIEELKENPGIDDQENCAVIGKLIGFSKLRQIPLRNGCLSDPQREMHVVVLKYQEFDYIRKPFLYRIRFIWDNPEFFPELGSTVRINYYIDRFRFKRVFEVVPK